METFFSICIVIFFHVQTYWVKIVNQCWSQRNDRIITCSKRLSWAITFSYIYEGVFRALQYRILRLFRKTASVSPFRVFPLLLHFSYAFESSKLQNRIAKQFVNSSGIEDWLSNMCTHNPFNYTRVEQFMTKEESDNHMKKKAKIHSLRPLKFRMIPYLDSLTTVAEQPIFGVS